VLAVAATQARMARGEQPLELAIDARRLSPVRPSPVTTLIACHSSAIVLDPAARETAQAARERR
jgi:hypothetical protein